MPKRETQDQPERQNPGKGTSQQTPTGGRTGGDGGKGRTIPEGGRQEKIGQREVRE